MLSDPEDKLRLASGISTSAGELTLVGTWLVENVGGPLVRPTLESAGKTRYTSTITLVMLAPDATAVRPSSLGIGEIETGDNFVLTEQFQPVPLRA